MKIEQSYAWMATAFGAVGVTAGAIALGRGWTKIGSGALLLSVSVPAACWFQYFMQVDPPINNAPAPLQDPFNPWDPEQVKNLAMTQYQKEPVELLDRVPKDKVMWCLENCWDEETREKAGADLLQHILNDQRVDYWVNGIGIEKFKPFLRQSFVLCMRVVQQMKGHGEAVKGVLALMAGWEDQVTSNHFANLNDLGLLTSELCASDLENSANPAQCLRWVRKACRTEDDLKILEEVIGCKWDETGIVVAGELHKARLHAYFLGGEEEKVTKGDEVFIKYELEVFGDIDGFSDRIKTACKKAGLDIEAVDHGAEE